MTLKLKDLQNMVSQLPKDALSFIIGDLNHDLAHDKSTTLLTELENIGFRQYVDDSTIDYGSTPDHIYYNGRVDMQINVCIGFRQYVNDSTTDYGSALDHIYYNARDDMQIYVLHAYFSDHDLITITLKP